MAAISVIPLTVTFPPLATIPCSTSTLSTPICKFPAVTFISFPSVTIPCFAFNVSVPLEASIITFFSALTAIPFATSMVEASEVNSYFPVDLRIDAFL